MTAVLRCCCATGNAADDRNVSETGCCSQFKVAAVGRIRKPDCAKCALTLLKCFDEKYLKMVLEYDRAVLRAAARCDQRRIRGGDVIRGGEGGQDVIRGGGDEPSERAKDSTARDPPNFSALFPLLKKLYLAQS